MRSEGSHYDLSRISDKIKDTLKENEVAINYCAIVVAIVLVRYFIGISKFQDQWIAVTLPSSLNLLLYSESVTLRVHCPALKQGNYLLTVLLEGVTPVSD